MGNSAVPALLLAGGAYLLLRPDPATGESPLGSLLSGGGESAAGGGDPGDLPLSPSDSFPAFDANGDGVIDDADRTAIYTPGLAPGGSDDGGPGFDSSGSGAPGGGGSRKPSFLERAFSPENLGFAALFAVPALVRGAPAAGRAAASGISRAGSSVVRGVSTAARATGQAAGRVAPRAATAVRFATTGAAGVATGVAGGLALGQGAVTVLQRTGALDAVARTGQRADLSTAQRQGIQAATAPLQYLGAVSSGLAGQGSVRGNVREVNQAVVQTAQRVVVQPATAAYQNTVGRVSTKRGKGVPFIRGI